ncbi:glucose-6-phosphate dehydrogenase [Clostridium thermarum]|uniref:glucose-6-phosphate dehydrogenase n=1 Tax=Clostridium thermarum TaxID=1716543 RepID=UPI0013D7B661|nr:glucose-6-phosphate dehydrogenase [Clostridium thermarum]
MQNKLQLPAVMVIFGGTGDLTHRKLMPSLYNLFYQGLLPDNFAVVSVGRRDLTDEEYRNQVKESTEKFARFKLDEELWNKMKEVIYYVRFNFDDDDGYVHLKGILSDLDNKYNTAGNRLYYLAVSPEYFEVIVDKLDVHKMALVDNCVRRIVIEKPFGRDLASATYLNEQITRVFKEENTYRIDHYLGKEMIQNIMVMRFANSVFEHLWNNRYIDNIQISSTETVGVENRGGYYENAGALKDMVQNHMFQLLTLTAMEPPVNLETESIRDEKVKVLRSLQPVTEKFVRENMVRGQYGRGEIGIHNVKGYREEDRVSPESDTETFVAMKLYIENYRWAGVPFYIRSGKRMANKTTEIVVQFKSLPKILYAKDMDLQPSLLVIKVQPKEGIMFQFNAKKPGTGNEIIPIQMDFCQNCSMENDSPEAYERLISDLIKGDSTLFTRWDEVEFSWKYVDDVTRIWRNEKTQFPNYAAGSWGPEAAHELLRRDGRQWWLV